MGPWQQALNSMSHGAAPAAPAAQPGNTGNIPYAPGAMRPYNPLPSGAGPSARMPLPSANAAGHQFMSQPPMKQEQGGPPGGGMGGGMGGPPGGGMGGMDPQTAQMISQYLYQLIQQQAAMGRGSY